MKRTAKSVILDAPGQLSVRDIPVPEIAGPSHRLRLGACGICGSDLRYLAGENPWSMHTLGEHIPSPPNMVLGHEVSGVTEIDGRERRVAVLAYRGCGRCRECRRGRENLCADTQHIGHGAGWGEMDYYPGGMAEEFEVWEGFAYEIPDTVSFEEATFLDGLAVAVHACDQAGIDEGSRVAIVGLGPIGMLAAQVAGDRGAEVVTACDTTGLPVELARGLGFESTYVCSGAALFDDASGFDAVVDTVGDIAAIEAGLASLAPGGRVVLLAAHEGTLSYNATRICSERYVTTSANNRYADFPRAIELMSSGRVCVSSLVTHRFALDEAPGAFEIMASKDANRAYKIVLVP